MDGPLHNIFSELLFTALAQPLGTTWHGYYYLMQSLIFFPLLYESASFY